MSCVCVCVCVCVRVCVCVSRTIMSHESVSGGRHMKASRHTCGRIVSRLLMSDESDADGGGEYSMSHGTHMDNSWHTFV